MPPHSSSQPRRVLGGTTALWVGFVIVHLVLITLGLGELHQSTFNDVDIYRSWMATGAESGSWPVFDYPWVYPAAALVPMLSAWWTSGGTEFGYLIAWCAQVTILNGIALAVVQRVAGRTPKAGTAPGWFWLTFLAALGTVSIGRIDAIAAPLTLIALCLAARYTATSSAMGAFAAWIKIFPGAFVLAAMLTTKRWLFRVLLPAAAVTGAIAAVVVAGGGAANLFSFLTEQGGRGLQIEAVIATPDVLLRALSGQPTGTYNADLNTIEVPGAASQVIASLSIVLLIALIVMVAALIWRARGHEQALVIGTFALTAALIIGNKVGSPQFLCALAPAIAVALALWPRDIDIRRLALGLLAIAFATQLVFPWTYDALIGGRAGPAIILSLRNLGLLAVFGYSCWMLARRQHGHVAERAELDTASV